jgi:hypothetical protein
VSERRVVLPSGFGHERLVYSWLLL